MTDVCLELRFLTGQERDRQTPTKYIAAALWSMDLEARARPSSRSYSHLHYTYPTAVLVESYQLLGELLPPLDEGNWRKLPATHGKAKNQFFGSSNSFQKNK